MYVYIICIEMTIPHSWWILNTCLSLSMITVRMNYIYRLSTPFQGQHHINFHRSTPLVPSNAFGFHSDLTTQGAAFLHHLNETLGCENVWKCGICDAGRFSPTIPSSEMNSGAFPPGNPCVWVFGAFFGLPYAGISRLYGPSCQNHRFCWSNMTQPYQGSFLVLEPWTHFPTMIGGWWRKSTT